MRAACTHMLHERSLLHLCPCLLHPPCTDGTLLCLQGPMDPSQAPRPTAPTPGLEQLPLTDIRYDEDYLRFYQ